MALILVVDDDNSCRNVLSDLLESEGFSVITAENGIQALRLLRCAADKPSLCLVDFMMPQMNGFELIRELRRNEETRATSVIMLTATHKQIRETVQIEGVSYLNKNASTRQILDCIYKEVGKPNVSKTPLNIETPRWEPARIIQDYYPADEARKEAVQPDASAAQRATSPARRFPDPVDRIAKESVAGLSKPCVQSLILMAPPRLSMVAEKPTAPVRLASRAAGTPIPRGKETTLGESASGLVNDILESAVARQASDIHIEPRENELVVRIRVDGVLQSLLRLPSEIKASLAARIKVLAELNITERRLPQDGHFNRLDPEGRKVQFRVSTLPSLYGEKIVARILRSGKLRVKLDALSLSERNRDVINGALKASIGLILVTGPTGSGKTTTLYGMLDTLNTPLRNIVTAEDPVEYELDGVNHVQVHAEIGYTFERILRSFMRQDPNVILVGEIRDAETASIALKAAMTGHMVLSSLHTNDAPATLQRLISMGIPAYLVAAACRLVVAQRLLRLLCPQCKREGALIQAESALLAPEERQPLSKVWRARGCSACHGAGYMGRQAIFEVMPVASNAMRQAIIEQASPEQLRALAAKEGMVSLRQEALGLVAKGLTSPEEAFAVLYSS